MCQHIFNNPKLKACKQYTLVSFTTAPAKDDSRWRITSTFAVASVAPLLRRPCRAGLQNGSGLHRGELIRIRPQGAGPQIRAEKPALGLFG